MTFTFCMREILLSPRRKIKLSAPKTACHRQGHPDSAPHRAARRSFSRIFPRIRRIRRNVGQDVSAHRRPRATTRFPMRNGIATIRQTGSSVGEKGERGAANPSKFGKQISGLSGYPARGLPLSGHIQRDRGGDFCTVRRGEFSPAAVRPVRLAESGIGTGRQGKRFSARPSRFGGFGGMRAGCAGALPASAVTAAGVALGNEISEVRQSGSAAFRVCFPRWRLTFHSTLRRPRQRLLLHHPPCSLMRDCISSYSL